MRLSLYNAFSPDEPSFVLTFLEDPIAMTFQKTLASLLLAFTLAPSLSFASEPLELPDIATPEQIYSEMIASGRYAELLGADETELDVADHGRASVVIEIVEE